MTQRFSLISIFLIYASVLSAVPSRFNQGAYLGPLNGYTTASRTALVASAGLIVYDFTLKKYYTWNGTAWEQLGTGSGSGLITSINTGTGTVTIIGSYPLSLSTSTVSGAATITMTLPTRVIQINDSASGAFVIKGGTGATVGTSRVGSTTTLTINSTVTGSGTDAISLQGTPVSNASPTEGQILKSVSGSWTPITLAPASWSLNSYNGPSRLSVTGGASFASSTAGGSTTFTLNVTATGGGTTTATPTFYNSATASWTKTLAASWSVEVIASGVLHNDLKTKQGGQAGEYYHLSNASHSLVTSHPARIDNPHSVTLTQVGGAITASPTFNNSATISWASDTANASWTASVIIGGIAHNELATKQGGVTSEYYHLSAASHTLVSSHPSRTDNPHTVTAAQVNNSVPQWNADKVMGTTWGTASPTGIYAYVYYNATETKYMPLKIIGTGSTTVSIKNDSSSATLTISSTDTSGGSTGSVYVPDIYFNGFELHPNDNIATAVRILNVGSDFTTLNFKVTTASGPETVWLSARNIPSNYVSGKKLRIKIGGCTVNSGSNDMKFQLIGTVLKSGDAIIGSYTEFTKNHTFTVTSSSTNRLILDTSDLDIDSSYLEAGAPVMLKLTRVAPAGTQSTGQFRLTDIVGVFEQ